MGLPKVISHLKNDSGDDRQNGDPQYSQVRFDYRKANLYLLMDGTDLFPEVCPFFIRQMPVQTVSR
ncbi:hypothetical protein KGP36_04020 [Patescibacteria group bacterium]|nr:hypothetical protein [Patescibacteria group bacterium]